MKKIPSKTIHVFDPSKLKDHGFITEFGFSVHRDIVILWDKDYDNRIIKFIDNLSERSRRCLVLCQESEGHLTIIIDETIPPASIDRYAYEGGVDVEEDTWTVTKYYCDDF